MVEGVVEAGRDDGAGLSGREEGEGEEKKVSEHSGFGQYIARKQNAPGEGAQHLTCVA